MVQIVPGVSDTAPVLNKDNSNRLPALKIEHTCSKKIYL